MTNVLNESEIVSRTEAPAGRAATCCGHEAQELARRIKKGVSGAKAAVFAKLEEGEIATERLLRRGRYAVEDGIIEAAHDIRRHPFRSLAIAFAAGAALGIVVCRSVKR
jgi:ElaB/YqjD/DUF883 family membrane-anchored ribosome-binding protein